jgi:hypothetical protein
MIGTDLEYKPSGDRQTGTHKHNACTPNKGQYMFAIFVVTFDDTASQSCGMAHTDVWKVSLQGVTFLGIFYAVATSCQTCLNLIGPHQAAYGGSGKPMKLWQCLCCLIVDVVQVIVVQKQCLACPFSFVLLDFVMKLCEGVKMTVVPSFGKVNCTKVVAYCLTSLASFMLKIIELLVDRCIREEGFL